jgi:hypothetical protein
MPLLFTLSIGLPVVVVIAWFVLKFAGVVGLEPTGLKPDPDTEDP